VFACSPILNRGRINWQAVGLWLALLIKGISLMNTPKNPYNEQTGCISAANGENGGSVCSTEASATKNGTLARISSWL
jgi:hypothetical protein